MTIYQQEQNEFWVKKAKDKFGRKIKIGNVVRFTDMMDNILMGQVTMIGINRNIGVVSHGILYTRRYLSIERVDDPNDIIMFKLENS